VADGGSDRGYTSDSELYDTPKQDSALSASDTKLKPTSGSWLMVSSAQRCLVTVADIEARRDGQS